jgi:hypothetical protein
MADIVDTSAHLIINLFRNDEKKGCHSEESRFIGTTEESLIIAEGMY